MKVGTASHTQHVYAIIMVSKKTSLTGSPPHQAGFLRSLHDKQNFLLMLKSYMSLSTIPWLSGYKPCRHKWMHALQQKPTPETNTATKTWVQFFVVVVVHFVRKILFLNNRPHYSETTDTKVIHFPCTG